MKRLRRLYEWVLSWADTPYGPAALALLAFTESSIFPVPPDVLLIALCIGQRTKAFRFALICSIASVVGGAFGYLIGWALWHGVDQFFYQYVPGFTEEGFESVRQLYERYNFWVVFVAAFTPIPYKIITVAAGVFVINFPMFMIASVIGRSLRFYLVAGLLYLFGERVRTFIDTWFNLLVIVFTLLLLGGVLALKYWGH